MIIIIIQQKSIRFDTVIGSRPPWASIIWDKSFSCLSGYLLGLRGSGTTLAICFNLSYAQYIFISMLLPQILGYQSRSRTCIFALKWPLQPFEIPGK